MLGFALVVGFAGLSYFSLKLRAREHLRQTDHGLPVEPKQSAFSQAAVDLLATAGGIYLALLLARNFLQIAVPSRVKFLGFQLEPLAALSLLIALIQPYLSIFGRHR